MTTQGKPPGPPPRQPPPAAPRPPNVAPPPSPAPARPAPPPPSTAARPAQAPPPPVPGGRPATAPGKAKPCAIYPDLAGAEAAACPFGVTWQAVALGDHESCGATITSTSPEAFEITVEQPPYVKSQRGQGSFRLPPIPPAAPGTTGRLRLRDTATGTVVEFAWQWREKGLLAAGRRRDLVASAGPRVDVGSAAGQSDSASAASPSTETQVQASTAAAAEAEPASAFDAAPEATTAFFGISSAGRRFAFIIDISGSMEGRRIESCRAQFRQALAALPETAAFAVILFSDRLREPPWQAGWTRATGDNVARAIGWVESVPVGGGTVPRPAFERAFSLAADVIFFLTDGDLAGLTPAECAQLNGGFSFGRLMRKLFTNNPPAPPAVIHTIALDCASSERDLRKLAADSGGEFRMVSSSGGPAA